MMILTQSYLMISENFEVMMKEKYPQIFSSALCHIAVFNELLNNKICRAGLGSIHWLE